MISTSWTRLILVFALLFPGLGAIGYFILAQDQWLRVVYSASKVIQFTLPAIWIFAVLREPFSTRKITIQNAVAGLKTGVVFFALTLVAYFFIFDRFELLNGTGEAIWQKVSEFGVTSPLSFIFMAVYISILHSFLEEYYWRWFVYRKLREFMGFTGALIISSVGFTIHHVVVIGFYAPAEYAGILIPLAALSVFFAGTVWAYQYERSKSLWVVWVSHLLTDVALMVVGYHLISSKL